MSGERVAFCCGLFFFLVVFCISGTIVSMLHFTGQTKQKKKSQKILEQNHQKFWVAGQGGGGSTEQSTNQTCEECNKENIYKKEEGSGGVGVEGVGGEGFSSGTQQQKIETNESRAWVTSSPRVFLKKMFPRCSLCHWLGDVTKEAHNNHIYTLIAE